MGINKAYESALVAEKIMFPACLPHLGSVFPCLYKYMKTTQNEKFTRQPALRLFAAELAESRQTIIEHVEGRDFDSRHQLTPVTLLLSGGGLI